MIEFHSSSAFDPPNKLELSDWLTRVIASENAFVGDLNYIFCTDAYILKLNKRYLSHDTYTDIITFDYSEGSSLSGDIFISVDRVLDNARMLDVDFEEELLRVMAHGILHLAGYKDKSKVETAEMRKKENEKIKMFHVEH